MKSYRIVVALLALVVIAFAAIQSLDRYTRAIDKQSGRATFEQCANSEECVTKAAMAVKNAFNAGRVQAGDEIARICLNFREFQVRGQKFTCQRLEPIKPL